MQAFHGRSLLNVPGNGLLEYNHGPVAWLEKESSDRQTLLKEYATFTVSTVETTM